MISNTEKITKEFCQGKVLIFYPKTPAEAEFIQRKVFEVVGYKWGNSDLGNTVGYVDKCVLKGMVIKDGVLYHAPGADDLQIGVLCTAGQFGEKYQSDRELMLELFNKLSTRMDRIDALSAKVDAMYEEVMPKNIVKPSPLIKQRAPGSAP